MPSALKFAIRALRRSPGFTLLAVSILTLGIGATTAMFSITRTVLLKPLAYRDPQELVTIMFRIPSYSKQISTITVNAQHYQLWRDHSRTIRQLAMLAPVSNILSGAAEPEQVNGARVSANFFQLLGAQPMMGRAFAAGEDQAGRNHVAVISDRLWRHQLHRSADVLGQKILLNGEPHQVIGVMPAAFPFPRGAQLSGELELPDRTDYWVPLVYSQSDLSGPISNMDYFAIARLKKGVTLQQASADLTALEKVIAKSFPQSVEIDVVLHPLQQLMSRDVRVPLLVLMAAVGTILLIVCINMLNLTMVRAIAQRREWAVKLAIGASARHLLSGAIVQSLLLGLPAAALGSLLAAWLLELVRWKAPISLPRIEELSLDVPALLFAIGISVAAALLFGVWPAWRSARIDPQEALQSSGRTASEGRKGHRLGAVLVAAEVALSTVLLIAAGLLLRSFVTILGVDPGVKVQHLLAVHVNLPPDKYADGSPAIHSFYKRLLERITAMPAVEAAGTVSNLPITTDPNDDPVTAGDRAAPPLAEWSISHLHSASSGYFKAAGIPLKDGRPFEERDGNTLEVVISDNLAARLWPGQSAVGRPLKIYSAKRMAKVAGVVGAVHVASLTEEPGRMVYFPDWLQAERDMSVLVRTAGEPENLSAALRGTIRQLEPQAAIPSVQTMRQVVEDSLSAQRFQTALLATFALAALLLACLGIYGVLAFATGRRTSEIGLRMALGARPKQILAATLRSGITPAAIGIIVGLGASVSLSRVLAALLFQVPALDPLIYFATSLVLLLVAALACWVPARRAAMLNPLEALRHE